MPPKPRYVVPESRASRPSRSHRVAEDVCHSVAVDLAQSYMRPCCPPRLPSVQCLELFLRLLLLAQYMVNPSRKVDQCHNEVSSRGIYRELGLCRYM